MTFKGSIHQKLGYAEMFNRLSEDIHNFGWLEAAASAHNKEMHAENGNIDALHETLPNRNHVIRACKQSAWNMATIQADPNTCNSNNVTRMMRHQPVIYYTRNVSGGSQVPTIAGTLHQWLGNTKKLKMKPPSRHDTANETTDTRGVLDSGGGMGKDEVDRLRRAACHTKWAGVAIVRVAGRKHGELEPTGMSMEMLEAATNPNAPTLDAINPLMGRYTYGRLANAIHCDVQCGKHDHRVLALKVDLYDELRERRMVQPSGVDYAWSSTREYEPTFLNLVPSDGWHYDAIFVTMDIIELAFRQRGRIQVGEQETDTWQLGVSAVKIITLGENGGAELMGRDAWIISHLRYPLAWTLDQFQMHTVGRDEPEEEIFLRTAGLVDINDPAYKLVFVVPNKTTTAVSLGGHRFDVVTTDHHGEMPAERKIPFHDVDDAIWNTVRGLLNYKGSLREAFTQYLRPYFPAGINWLEINLLSVLLTTRWHQKIEGVRTGDEDGGKVLYWCAPSDVIENLGLVPDPSLTPDSYPGYGGANAVSSFDHRFVGQQSARMNPIITLGDWGDIASLAVASGYATFNTRNTEDIQQGHDRCRSGGLDRLARAGYMRKGFENWKRAAAQTDGIAFPLKGSINDIGPYWEAVISGEAGCCAEWFANKFISRHVRWNWNANLLRDEPRSGTFTGTRVPSSWTRLIENTEWSSFRIVRSGRPTIDDPYAFDDCSGAWSTNMYCQFGQGEDDLQLEQALCRLDMTREESWHLTYGSHPGCEKLDGIRFVVDSSAGGVMARRLGWREIGSAEPVVDKWGWGVQVRIKDYGRNRLKTLAIPIGTGEAIMGQFFSEGTILYRGSRDEALFPGFQMNFTLQI